MISDGNNSSTAGRPGKSSDNKVTQNTGEMVLSYQAELLVEHREDLIIVC